MNININRKRGYLELETNNCGPASSREFIDVGNLKCSVGKDPKGNVTNIMIMNAGKLFDLQDLYYNVEKGDGFEKEID